VGGQGAQHRGAHIWLVEKAVCFSLSLHDSAQQEISAAPPALPALLYQSLQAAPTAPAARHQPLGQAVPCGAACCWQGWLAAGASGWRGRSQPVARGEKGVYNPYPWIYEMDI
jgi:hypothetical protein